MFSVKYQSGDELATVPIDPRLLCSEYEVRVYESLYAHVADKRGKYSSAVIVRVFLDPVAVALLPRHGQKTGMG